MKKFKHPLLFNNFIIHTNGSMSLITSVYKEKKKFKFLDVDTCNNKQWVSTKGFNLAEQKTRLNRFKNKFKIYK